MIQHLHKTLFLREKISIKLVAFPVDSLSQFSTSVVPKRSVFLCFLSDSVELMTSTTPVRYDTVEVETGFRPVLYVEFRSRRMQFKQ